MPKTAVNRQIVRELHRALDYLGADRSLADIGPVDLYKKLEALGANRELLTIVGSWGDTLSDKEVLELLKEWNAAEAKFRSGGCKPSFVTHPLALVRGTGNI